MITLESHKEGTLLPVKAHAGARKNKVAGVHNGMLKISVTAAPEKGKANTAIASVLGAAIGVSKSSIELVAGGTSPQKRFLIRGIRPSELQGRLSRALIEADR